MAIEVEKLKANIDVDVSKAIASLTAFKAAISEVSRNTTAKITVEYDKKGVDDFKKSLTSISKQPIDIKARLIGDAEVKKKLDDLSKNRSATIDVEVNKDKDRTINSYFKSLTGKKRKATIEVDAKGISGVDVKLSDMIRKMGALQNMAKAGLAAPNVAAFANLTRIFNPLVASLWTVNSGFSRFNQALGGASQRAMTAMGHFSAARASLASFGKQFLHVGKIMTVIKFGTLLSAFAVLPGLIAGATGAVMAFVTSLAYLGSFLAGGLIAGLGAFAGGLLSVIAGLSGVGAGVTALKSVRAPKISAPKVSGGGGGGSTAQAAKEAANKRLEQANRNRIQSERAVRDAIWAVEDAEWSLKKATEAVTDAREDAAQNLLEYGWAAREAALDEQDAVDALKRAQQELADIQNNTASSTVSMLKQTDYFTGKIYEVATATADVGSGASREEEQARALRDVERAQIALERAQNNTIQTQKQYNEAQKQGIEGSDLVINALRAERDAKRSLIHANEGLSDAQLSLKDSADQIAEATQGVSDALAGYGSDLGGVSAASNQWAQAQQNLSKEGQDFVTFLVDRFLPAWQKVQFAAQRGLLPPVQKGLEYLLNVMPQVEDIFYDFARATGTAFEEGMKLITTEENFKRFKETMIGVKGESEGLAGVWKTLLSSIAPLHLAFVDIAKAATPMMQAFSKDLLDGVTDFSEKMREMSDNKSMSKFFTESYDMTKKLGKALWEVIKTINSVIIASKPLTEWILEGITEHFSELNDTLKKDEGRKKLTAWFDGLKPVISVTVGLIGDLFKAFSGGNSQQATVDFLQQLRDDVIPNLGEAFDRLTNSAIPGFIGKLLELASGALPGLISLFSGIVEGIKPLYPVFDILVAGFNMVFNEKTEGIIAALTPVLLTLAGSLWAVVTASKGAVFFGDVMEGFDKLSGGGIKNAGDLLDFFKKKLLLIPLAIKSLGKGLLGLPGMFMKAFSFAFSGPGLLVVAIIAAIATAVWLIVDNWETIGPIVQGFIDNLVSGFNGLKEDFDNFVKGFKDGIGQFVEGFMGSFDKFQPTFDSIKEAFGDSFGAMAETIGDLWDNFSGFFDKLKPKGEEVQGLFGGFADKVKPFGEAIGNIFGAILSIFGGLWAVLSPVISLIVTAVAGTLMGAFAGLWVGIKIVFDGVVNIIGGFFDFVSGFSDILVGVFTLDWEKIKGGFSTLVAGIGQILGGLVQAVVGVFVTVFGTVTGAVAGFVNGIIQWFVNLYEELVGHSIIPDMVNGIIEWFGNLWNGAVAFVKNIYDSIVNKFNEIKLSVILTVLQLVQKFQFHLNQWLLRGKLFIEGLKTAFITGFVRIGTNIVNSLVNIKNSFINKTNEIKAKWDLFWTNMKQLALLIFGKMKDALNERLNSLKKNFESFVSGVKGIWDKLKGIAAKPVEFVINSVVRPLAQKFNKIADTFKIKNIPVPAEFKASYDTGGYTGPGGKYEPAGIVHRDEYVIRKESQKRISRDFPGLLDFMNTKGALPSSSEISKITDPPESAGRTWRTLQGYSSGGMVGSGLVYSLPIHGYADGGKVDDGGFIGTLLGGLKSLVSKVIPGEGIVKDIATAIPEKIWDGLVSFVKDKLGSLGGGGGSMAGATTGGLNPQFLKMFQSWNAALGNKYRISVGYRSPEQQARLYHLYITGQRNIVAAPPGKSKHQYGLAIDHSPNSTARDRLLGKAFGLRWPMSYEPWHVQPYWAQFGSSVKKNQPYIVGEKRPELFIPNTGGRIAPTVPKEAYGGQGLSESQLEAILERILEKAKPNVEMNNTFNEKADPKQIASDLAWNLRR